ncbi:MAG: orotidine-5'-phosphate decarboxylase [Pseudomonadota bacterium]|nr:orotidine-5'-phosphate decarboxylase [Pseudomonadota bacterium]
MEPRKFIFCAIDFSDLKDAKKFISKIINHIGGVKIGLEFFLKNGPNGVSEIKKLGLPLFLDLKLNDIPNTVKKAAENIIQLNPDYLSVHLNGGSKMISELVAIKKNTKILGVSMLTSLDKNDLEDFGLRINEKKYVENLAKIGIKAGIDGLVSSAHEVPFLKKRIKKKILFVTPGIRLPENNCDDQKRIISPGKAIKLGSSMLIVGRSITKAINPIETIKRIVDDIEANLEI